MKLNFLIGFVLLLICPLVTRAQSDFFAIWLDNNHKNKIGEKLSLVTDYGYRFRVDYDYKWQRVHSRTGLVIKPNEFLKLYGGIGLFYSWAPTKGGDFEFRPWQGVSFKWPKTNRIELTHLSRIEERFYYLNNIAVPKGFYFELKLRYMLYLKFKINKKESNKGTWFANASFEPFLNLYSEGSSLTVDKSRTALGLSYFVTNKSKIRVQYIYQPDKIPILQDITVYSNVVRISYITGIVK